MSTRSLKTQQRDRWESEERNFIVSVVVTQVYTRDITVRASSDEDALAQLNENQSDYAHDVVSGGKLEEVILEVEGCYDPITSLDD
tara:strand:+ start:263 stop:520 length:258 start_codon:yes stop_codon:yes gene_type:complete